MVGGWQMTCFDYDIIQDIQVKEVNPNGYVKMISSKEGDVIYYYFNKDGLFIKEQTEIRQEENRDYKGVNLVTFAERPFVFDKPTMIWFQVEINKLRTKNVEYIDVIMNQSDTIRNQQDKMNSYLADIGNLKRLNEQK